MKNTLRALAAATAMAFMLNAPVEGVDVRVEHDKAFDFKSLRTWGWNPAGPGELRMARTQLDDPDAMKAKAEPVLVDAVTMEMTKRGLQTAASQPDATVTYFLLLSTNMSAQTMGQFLPATAAWGLPPFAPATQSLTMMNMGSLVLDMSAKGVIVWRGVAQAKLKVDADPKKREALLREAVRDLLKKFPPKQ